MRFDRPVLLYGAGREARSTRAFLQKVAPETEVFVAVDSGAAEIENAEPIAPQDLPAAIEGRRFGLIVKSPGVPLYKPIFAQAAAAGIPVTSNLNLWGQYFRAGRKVVAITGTKGKSTTATLTALMLEHSGVDVGLAGNVGVPPLEAADRHTVIVLELSSYQTADLAFAPDIAAITNLYPEHIDWHGSVERYFSDKLNLLARPGQFMVALGDAAASNPRVGAAIRQQDQLLPPLTGEAEAAIAAATRTSRLRGAHNFDNARLAARIALAAGASLEGIAAGIGAFKPLPHRLEEHRLGGIVFVDDSISTTPEATKAALAAYRGYRIALLAGGHERQQDYGELAQRLTEFGVTTLACLPVTGTRLASAVRSLHPAITVIEAEDVRQAMTRLADERAGFDAVILSPGAPSYNQFKNFEERGRAFVALARELFGPEP